MKKDILKIAGVKSEKEFYKKYPTEAAFMKAHGKEFKKAAMGASMVNRQLHQLTDFANPPQAEVGTYIGGETTPSAQPMEYGEYFDQVDRMVTGKDREMRMQEADLAAQQQMANESGGGGFLGMLGQLAPQLDSLSSDAAGGLRRGGYVRKAQNGLISMPDFTKADQTINKQFKFDNSKFGQGLGKFNKGVQDFGKDIGAGYDKLNTGLGKVGGVSGAIGIAGDLLGGFQQLGQEKQQKKQAKQFAQLSGVVKDASASRPEETRRRYVRPEDNLVDPGQTGSPYGTGSNFLQMAYGGTVGGNPTEIQNTYAPDVLYSNLGYEPLSESEVVKQYRKGGKLEKSQFGSQIAGQLGGGLGSLIGGGKGRPTAGGKIGSTVGGTLGNVLLPGVGGIIGGALGGLVGGIFGGKSAKETARYQKQGEQNMQAAAFQNAGQNIQTQNASFMRDGGGLAYLSNDWQPQVITKFGDYDVKDLLKPPHDADMLRAGGHLKEYTAPSAEAMFTGRPNFQMGGELQTHWGGDAETVSYNPYLPDSGETVMFRGQSHEESDGNGRTGIGITYGDNPVEVERGEPAVKLQDGGTGENSLVVYGNMKIPSYGVSELNDPKAKGKKFKRYVDDLNKIEAKQNKIIDKSMSQLDEDGIDSPFELLKFNANKAMLTGADMKLKQIAEKKKTAAGIQNAILDTAEEMGLESDALAKGKIKKSKESDMAKFGKKLPKAQPGITQPLNDRWNKYLPDKAPSVPIPYRSLEDYQATNPKNLEEIVIKAKKKTDESTSKTTEDTKKKKSDFMDVVNQLTPYLRPSNQMSLDPNQLSGEMFALATNQLEPVQAQTFQPMLEEVATISLQDQLNEIQAQANASKRLAGNNPAALAMIDAQVAEAKNKVLGEQLRTNMGLQLESRRRNLATLNDATLKNLAILDQQYTRQAQAKSATKAQAQAALNSVADKIAKNKLENRTLGIYENMYNYRFGPKGMALNMNPLAQFSTDLATKSIEEVEEMYKKLEKEIKSREKGKEKSKNGSIVKAIKNL